MHEFWKMANSKYDDLLQFREVTDWLKELPAENTRYSYAHRLSVYLNFRQMTPKELIDEASEIIRSGNSEARKRIHDKLLEFHEWLKAKGSSIVEGGKQASWTSTAYYSAMRSFYRYNGIELPKFSKRIKSEIVTEHEKGYIPSPDEVFKMLSFAKSTRDKSIIATAGSSGQRAGALCALKYGHIREQLEQDAKVIIVNVPKVLPNFRGKNVNKYNVEYSFGIGAEAVGLIKQMLDERRKDGEVIDDESWLFRSYAVAHRISNRQGYKPQKISKKTRGPPLTAIHLNKIIEKTAITAGLMEPRKIRGQRLKIHTHSLRKYFKKQALLGVKEARELQLVEFLMGHKTPPLQAAYPGVDFKDEAVIRKFYEQIEPHLSWQPKKTVSKAEIESEVKKAIDARLAELGFKEGLTQIETFITDLQKITGSAGAQGWQKLGERIRAGEVVLGVPDNIPLGTIRTFIGPNGKPFITQKGIVTNGEKLFEVVEVTSKEDYIKRLEEGYEIVEKLGDWHYLMRR